MKRLAAVIVVLALTAFGAARAEEAKGGLRYSITVSKFENRAGWSGQWDLGDAWGAVLTDALQGTKRFIVLGEKDMRAEALLEQDLAAGGRMAGGNKAPKTGQMTPAQLLVKGDITHVESSTSGGEGGLNFKGISIGGNKDKAEISVVIYVVDSRTGQVKASKTVTGKAGKRGLKLGYWGSGLGGLTGDMAGFQKDNLGQATSDAVNQAVEFILKELEDIPWEGSVVSATASKVIINRGTREGVTEGQSFIVGKVEELTDPDTGEILDRSVETIAKLTAKTVKEKVTICEATEGGDQIEKGMTVQSAP